MADPSVSLNESQQLFEFLKRSEKPLLVIPKSGTLDSYATALALARVLRAWQKEPIVVTADTAIPSALSFLPGHNEIRTSLEQIHVLHIDVNLKDVALQQFSHETTDHTLRLSLVPFAGSWKPQDVHTWISEYRYDLIVCIGAQNLASCDAVYKKHMDFFERTPVVNLDHSPSNERFGHVNVVDVTACATGEVLHDLLAKFDASVLDADVATACLSAMMANTQSFKSSRVGPKSLETASRLVEHGARRDQIVQHLFRTRRVETLRLWGRALARLKQDTKTKLIWSLLSQQDFLLAGADEKELTDVVDELLSSCPDAEMVFLAYEQKDRAVCAILQTEPPHDALALLKPFGPSGTSSRAQVCFIGKTIVEVEKMLLETM